jgi:hypothetical protein
MPVIKTQLALTYCHNNSSIELLRYSKLAVLHKAPARCLFMSDNVSCYLKLPYLKPSSKVVGNLST